MSQKLNDLPIGSLVKDPDSKFLDTPIIWKIADKNHTGYPDGAVTLITERCIAMRCFDAKESSNSDSDRQSYGNGRYAVSNIRQWLNSDAEAGKWYSAQHSTDAAPNSSNVWQKNSVAVNPYDTNAGFLNGFSQEFKDSLMETNLIVAKHSVDDSGSETVTDKIFLASNTEVGLANENSIVEGALLPIFSDNASRISYCTTEAIEDSNYASDPANDTTAWHWWLRTPYVGNTGRARAVHSSGALSYSSAYAGTLGVRPLCNLPSYILVSDTTDSDGCYTIIYSEPKAYLGVNNLAKEVKSMYIGVDNAPSNLYNGSAFADASAWKVLHGAYASLTIDTNNIATFKLDEVYNNYSNTYASRTLSVTKNHIYYACAEFCGLSDNSDVKPRLALNDGTSSWKGIGAPGDATETAWTKLSMRGQATASSESGAICLLMLMGGTDITAGTTIKWKNLYVYDLTAIYGEGNEPSLEWLDKPENFNSIGIARKVKEAYIGVNNVAKKFLSNDEIFDVFCTGDYAAAV